MMALNDCQWRRALEMQHHNVVLNACQWRRLLDGMQHNVEIMMVNIELLIRLIRCDHPVQERLRIVFMAMAALRENMLQKKEHVWCLALGSTRKRRLMTR